MADFQSGMNRYPLGSLMETHSRGFASMVKSSGIIKTMSLDGRDLLGTGQGLYLDCSCIPSGFYTPGTSNPIVKSLSGTDATGTAWGGVVLQDTYPPTGQMFQQYWFLRDGETGLHSFSRMAYYNSTVGSLGSVLLFAWVT